MSEKSLWDKAKEVAASATDSANKQIMNVKMVTRALVVLALLTSLGACASASKATSLFDQLGGMDQVRSLSDALVTNLASDSRTSSLLSNANIGALKTKTSDQVCAILGGGCKAPLSSYARGEGGGDEARWPAAGRHRRRAAVAEAQSPYRPYPVLEGGAGAAVVGARASGLGQVSHQSPDLT
ncbi:MAG: hypothetical protein ACREK6_20995 [Candidatus Rokuibacteriota bacterium]